jgi:hypothetical protein
MMPKSVTRFSDDIMLKVIEIMLLRAQMARASTVDTMSSARLGPSPGQILPIPMPPVLRPKKLRGLVMRGVSTLSPKRARKVLRRSPM